MGLFKGNQPVHHDNGMVWEVGQYITYIYEHGFSKVCSIPESVARSWLHDIDYRLHVRYGATDAEANRLNMNQWLNKLAIVVDVERGTNVYAVYNHDGRYGIWWKNVYVE